MSNLSETQVISKLRLVQLEEILQRQDNLLKNSKLIENLPDKGKSIKAFRDKVQKEIMSRKELQAIEGSINKLSISENGKYTQKLCDIEKIPEKGRYKPFSTLNTVKEVKPDSIIFKIMEDCTQCNKPTKLIPLSESINILKKQDEKVKEEQVKARHRRLMEKIVEYEPSQENDSDSSSSSELSDAEEGE